MKAFQGVSQHFRIGVNSAGNTQDALVRKLHYWHSGRQSNLQSVAGIGSKLIITQLRLVESNSWNKPLPTIVAPTIRTDLRMRHFTVQNLRSKVYT